MNYSKAPTWGTYPVLPGETFEYLFFVSFYVNTIKFLRNSKSIKVPAKDPRNSVPAAGPGRSLLSILRFPTLVA